MGERLQKKHGIDFLEAQKLWNEPGVIAASTNTSPEPRFLYIARMHKCCWTAIYTIRDDCIRRGVKVFTQPNLQVVIQGAPKFDL